MTTRRTLLCLCLVGLCQYGCSTESPLPDSYTMRDSAGVAIVENIEPIHAKGEGWSISQEPRVTIGAQGEMEGHQLFRVGGTTQLTNGRVVVANGGSSTLNFFGPDGGFLFSVGGEGEGPGEFTYLNNLWPLRGDTLAAWDSSRRVLSLFDPEGLFVSGTSVEVDAGFPQPIGLGAGGKLIALLNSSMVGELPPAGSVFRESASYGWFNRDGSFGDTLATVPGFERFTREVRGRLSTGRRPFGYWIFGAVGPESFYYGSGEAFEVSVFSFDGELRKLFRRVERDRVVHAEDVDVYKQDLMADAPNDPNAQREWRQMLDEAPYPEVFPALQRILVDKLGNLWVQEYERPREETLNWSVFDPAGRWVSDVQIPRELRVLEVGTDYVMGLHSDDLGIETVLVYDLLKSPG